VQPKKSAIVIAHRSKVLVYKFITLYLQCSFCTVAAIEVDWTWGI